MRAKPSFTQDLVRSLMALSILLYPVLTVAQDPAGKPAAGEAQGAAPNGSSGAPPPANGKLPAPNTTVVHLQVDGNLKGKLSILDSAGKPSPAQAKITFLQNGQVVATAQADAGGVFQVPGLKPGVYSVIASGPDGFAATTVQVLPFAGDAPAAELTLNMTLVPLNGADALSDLLAQTPADTPAPCVDPAAYGCGGGYGGGGGGGLGGLGMIGAALGAVGMGLGIGALSNETASPNKY